MKEVRLYNMLQADMVAAGRGSPQNSKHCTNCCAPRTVSNTESTESAPCELCGHDQSYDDVLLGLSQPSESTQRFQQQLHADVSRTPPLSWEALRSSHTGSGSGVSNAMSDVQQRVSDSKRVILLSDDRMLLHRASLPPFLER